ncbi:MAG: VOC family protein [Acidimicrobiia bacterium]
MPVNEIRVVIEVEDVDRALTLYRDVLGLQEVVSFQEEDARVVLLEAGRGTLELSNRAQTRMIDRIETGREIGASFRIAFGVDDTVTRTQSAVEVGATLVGEPAVTPWGSLNARLETNDGLQLTLFEESGDEEWSGER